MNLASFTAQDSACGANSDSRGNVDESRIELCIERKLRRLGLLVPDSWMTPAEAANYARLSTSHLLRLCRQGRGPPYAGDKKLMRFRRSQIDRWIERFDRH